MLGLAPDKLLHLKLGVPMAIMLAVVVFVAQYAGPGFAVALGAVWLGVGVEMYQKYRNEGEASWADAAASAAAGVVAGLGYELWRYLQ
jgi:VanZ family protein